MLGTRRRLVTTFLASIGLALAFAGCSSSSTSTPSPGAKLAGALRSLVAMPEGPPGAIALVQKGSAPLVTVAGVADIATGAGVTDTDYMRLASVSKAYNGAVALSLVQKGTLSLTDTVGERLPGMPHAWSGVTLAQMLHHTSGLPDYTKNAAFVSALTADPLATLTPQQLVGYVANDPLLFAPGSRYKYSDTDNIVVGLMVEAVTGQPYASALSAEVYRPLSLTHTSLPDSPAVGQPTLRGYAVEKGQPPEDVTSALSPSGAWASGGMVSTPAELNTFVRAYVGGHLFGSSVQRDQRNFVAGSSGLRGRGRTPPGSPSSGTRHGVGRSTATPGTTPVTPCSRRRHQMAAVRSWSRSTPS